MCRICDHMRQGIEPDDIWVNGVPPLTWLWQNRTILPRGPEVFLDVPEVCQIGTSILPKTLERQVGPSETKGPTAQPPEKKTVSK